MLLPAASYIPTKDQTRRLIHSSIRPSRLTLFGNKKHCFIGFAYNCIRSH